ncbi:dihydropteroate synthase [Halovenus aranensis]|uniref:Probable bifunctional folylpolyglutamate synthase/dihydropteroate synthase n=1 Tax=Halovenus aranensis TaxID=890420 RepID=A0A1G8X7G1_9EURY|nr:dihydropteroate synthase [Halovenus aranensis]SDJ86246.1 dihydropteroate synthase [Halovenus aranensis]
MNVHEAANFLFDLQRFPSRPGTDATVALLSELGNPQESLHCVQVAGSNGKGSTARMTESVLREAGLDVGRYTSPHLDDLSERITVNGRQLSERSLCAFVERTQEYIVDRAANGDAPTFFETVTALALWEFERQEVDVAVLEVGIGGKLDATSVVDPLASAVTAVTLEHTDLLGNDVETIARDMAHVAPADRPLVTGATGTALAGIEDVAGETTRVVESGTDTAGSVTVDYGGRVGIEGAVSIETDDRALDVRVPLLGAHQARNAGVAYGLVVQTADAAGVSVSEEAFERGFRNAHWPGRFEVMGHEPLVVLDGAHNPGGCTALVETLSSFEYDSLHLVFGAMADKRHREMAAALDDADTVVACEPDTDRAADNDALAQAFAAETDATVSTRSDVAGGLADTLADAGENDCVLVTGSLYTVGEARTHWTRTTIPKRAESVPAARNVLEGAHVTEPGAWRMRGKAVHRLLKTRVQPRQAQYLKEELLSLGGECAVSGLTHDEEKRDVVMMGTMAQFKRLCDKLDGQPYGLSPLADQVRETLGIGAEPPSYPWDRDTAVMGILNVTPDSFHDGGEYEAREDALERAEEMVEAGVDIVDIGGESTRPGADPVPAATERERVVPVVEALTDLDVLVSVDTRKASVARAALDAGANILNDVSGLEDPEMRLLAAEYDVPVVVMHSINTPVEPDQDIHYDDVVEDVIEELTERVLLAEKAGLDRSQIIVDPGLGFGKTAAESFELLDRIEEFAGLGCPVLVGHSHKSMFGHVGREDGERYEPTIAATALAADRGADIVRVHDVDANVAAVDVVEATRNGDD